LRTKERRQVIVSIICVREGTQLCREYDFAPTEEMAGRSEVVANVQHEVNERLGAGTDSNALPVAVESVHAIPAPAYGRLAPGGEIFLCCRRKRQ
jgi:hypothetical protein